MSRSSRTPKNYDGTGKTSKLLSELLPRYAKKFAGELSVDPKIVLDAWPLVIGPSLAPMAQAEKFEAGILYIRVNNSSLHSLLCGYEKKRLLHRVQEVVPQGKVRDLVLRMG